MTKEIYISSTPHETRLGVVEDDQLAEIYYERENEYTLAGSVYKGKVTRVLPGMQSAFVDVGLERDAFLYVTDFAEEQEDADEYTPLPQSSNGGNGGGRERTGSAQKTSDLRHEASHNESAEDAEPGPRRWRGRRGRRRGRGNQQQNRPAASQPEPAAFSTEEHTEFVDHVVPHEMEATFESAYPEETAQPLPEARIQATESHPHPSRHEAMVLPGESLSKYRRGQAAPAESQSPRVSTAVDRKPARPVSTFQPSTLIAGPIEWDGVGSLPGESLSRHKKKPASTPSFRTAEESTAETHSSPPTESALAHEHPIQQHPLREHPLHSQQPVTEELSSTEDSATAPAEHQEPEPTSASYRFDPTAPSAYRQSSVAEPEIEDGVSQSELSNSGEDIASQQSVPDVRTEPFFAESISIAETQPDESSSLAAEVSPSAAASQNFSVEPESQDAVEEIDENSALDEQQDSHIFNPGAGNIEEETIDEEEPELHIAHALADEEEYDDLIEETLNVQMDSGLLSEFVRDQHIEQRTRYSEEPGGQTSAVEEESFDKEAFLEDDSADIVLEEVPDEYDAPAEEEADEVANADAAQPQQNTRRPHRRGVRAQGGDRRRMRRSTAQMTNLPAITELLKPNQEILVQIAKEPIARKGARITSHIALPGRFLVFMPTVNHVGVSRKISSDEERQRLKHILLSEKGTASGGFIVRTAAATASEDDLRADIRFLLTLWAEIKQRADSSKPPALIYHDLGLVERILRDQVTGNFSAIWVDSEQDYERVLRFLNRFEPSLVRRVKLYTKETPLFEQFGIQEEINKALRSKVWLKSGGSIVINQTEALVAIDINTGKYVGKTARLEDTILKTNLDAIPEIVRQIRLRDLGGIIVIDFIDMDERKNRNKVMQALEEALKADRAPSKVLQFNDFGLVAITRKRVKQSLERTLSVPCYVCTGTGMVKGPLTVCNEIYVELRKMHRQIDRSDILLRVHPEVVKQLKASNGRWLSEMEEMSGKTIIVKSDPALHPEQFDIH